MFRGFSVCTSLLLVLASAVPALAQEAPPPEAPAAPAPAPPQPKVNALAEARAARAAGDHLAAAHAFEAAYAAKCDPALLYDIATQLEDGDDVAGALAYYKRFLAEATAAPAGLRQSVGPHLAELGLEARRRGLAGSPAKTVACGEDVALEAEYSGPHPKVFARPQPAPAPAPVAEVAEAPAEEEHLETEDPKAGVLLELELQPTSAWRGSFLVGASFGRFALGIGLDAHELALPAAADPTTAPTAVLVTPGVRVRLAESEDGKLECLAAVDFGLGTTFGGAAPGDADISTLLIDWRVGPVLRYWVHPQLALAARVGLGAEHVRLSVSLPAGGGSGDRTYSDVATFAALQVVGRF